MDLRDARRNQAPGQLAGEQRRNGSRSKAARRGTTFVAESTVDHMLALQRTRGNAYVQRLIRRAVAARPASRTDEHDPARVQPRAPQHRIDSPTLQRDDDEEMGFWERYEEAAMTQPRLMVAHFTDTADTVGEMLAEVDPRYAFFSDLYDLYWAFHRLMIALKKMPGGSETTPAQREQALSLAEKWQTLRERIEARNKREARAALKRARAGSKRLQKQVLFAYRDIYMAGQEPGDVDVGGGSMKDLAEQVTSILNVINEADAAVTGRSVTALIPVLDKTLSIVKLITGWKVTAPLTSGSEKSIAALQNAWSLATTVLGLSGMGKFLPLFSYIGPMLDAIAKQWSRLVGLLRKKNRIWWELREVVGDELPHPGAEAGGNAVFRYMKRVIRASSPPTKGPSDAVVEFFDDNREMFTRTMKEVMGGRRGVPTRSSWIVTDEVDPKKLNAWVFRNRASVWRLIYGRGMRVPTKRR